MSQFPLGQHAASPNLLPAISVFSLVSMHQLPLPMLLCGIASTSHKEPIFHAESLPISFKLDLFE
jgi:hypothetical protein